MRTKLLFVGLPIITLLLCVSALAAHAEEINQGCSSRDANFTKSVKRVNGYALQIERLKVDSKEDDRICRASVVSPSGRVIFQNDDWAMELHDITGKDLNGDGRPDAVFEGYSGGAHCCWTYWIVSLGDQPGIIEQLENQTEVNFKDIDKDGRIELWTYDGDFDYFDCLSHVETPFPTIVFRLEGRVLKDVGHEFKDQYDREIAEARAQLGLIELARFRDTKDICEGEPRDTMPKVLTIVFGYLYSGREQAAWQALEKMWPAQDVDRIRKKIIEPRGYPQRAARPVSGMPRNNGFFA